MREVNPSRILVLGFLAVIALGTSLLLLPWATVGAGLSFLQALFTATSAVCVTGLVVVDTGTTFTLFGQIVIMALIKIGALGFMTIATVIFIFLGKRITFRNRVLIQESLNHLSVKGVVRLVRTILLFSITAEAMGALVLGLRFAVDMGWRQGMYYGLFHSISAFGNAGFDIMGNFTSLTVYRGDLVVNLVVMALFILGGLGFTVVLDMLQNWGRPGRLSFHSKLALVFTALLLGVAFAVVLALEHSNPSTLAELPWGEKLLATAFTAATPRTAGFNTLPTAELRQSSQFFIILLMFIGASPASTGGGIKTVTMGVVLVAVSSIIRGNPDAALFKRRLPQFIIHKALAIIVLSLVLVATVTLVLSTIEPFEFLPLMFEAFSAFGTVGLSTGITPELTPLGKMLIIFTMFVGRVGPITLTLAFTRRLQPVNIRYPEERVMVG